jgi:hypothetical protein
MTDTYGSFLVRDVLAILSGRLVVQDIHNSTASAASVSASAPVTVPAHVQRDAPTHSMTHLPAQCTRGGGKGGVGVNVQ